MEPKKSTENQKKPIVSNGQLVRTLVEGPISQNTVHRGTGPAPVSRPTKRGPRDVGCKRLGRPARPLIKL